MPFCLFPFPRPGLWPGDLKVTGGSRFLVPSPLTLPTPPPPRPTRTLRGGHWPRRARGKLLPGRPWGPLLAAAVGPPAGRRKLPASPLPAAATRALRGQFRDPRPAAEGIPARVSGAGPQSPCPGRESLTPRAGNDRLGLVSSVGSGVGHWGCPGSAWGTMEVTPQESKRRLLSGSGAWGLGYGGLPSRAARPRSVRRELCALSPPLLGD